MTGLASEAGLVRNSAESFWIVVTMIVYGSGACLFHRDLWGCRGGYHIPVFRPYLDLIWGLFGVSSPLHAFPPTPVRAFMIVSLEYEIFGLVGFQAEENGGALNRPRPRMGLQLDAPHFVPGPRSM